MSDDAKRFRARARDCRRLVEDAKDDEAKRTLGEMAAELDEEADRIDRHERAG